MHVFMQILSPIRFTHIVKFGGKSLDNLQKYTKVPNIHIHKLLNDQCFDFLTLKWKKFVTKNEQQYFLTFKSVKANYKDDLWKFI